MAMHEIIFGCPECGSQLTVESEDGDMQGPCPVCQAWVTAPTDGSGAEVVDQPALRSGEPEALPHMPPPTSGRFPKLIGREVQVELDFDAAEKDVDMSVPASSPAAASTRKTAPPEVWIPDDDSSPLWWLRPWVWGVAAVSIALTCLIVDSLKIDKPVESTALVESRAPAVVPKPVPVPEPVQESPRAPVFVKRNTPPPRAVIEAVLAKPNGPTVPIPDPVVTVPDPVVTVPDPVVTIPDPVVTVPDPVVVVSEPAVLVPDPVVLIPDLAAADSDPVVSIPDPVHAAPALAPVLEPEPLVEVPSDESLKGLDAAALLDRFLSAETLHQRLPMILSRASRHELQKTCLAESLPPRATVDLVFRETHHAGSVEDSFFAVRFRRQSEQLAECTVLVRRVGDGVPKVMVDSFLDSYGGRLEAFAAKPSEGVGEFEVMVMAMASCRDRQVPAYEQKMTLRLMEKDQGKGIANAYFPKGSSIASLLEDGTFRLSYGSPTPCRVVLRWNRKEKPRQPYLEAVEIKAFGWGSE